jgi:hypothetical protein
MARFGAVIGVEQGDEVAAGVTRRIVDVASLGTRIRGTRQIPAAQLVGKLR